MTGIKVKYSTKERYIYISVLTNNTSFPLLFHLLKKIKAYTKPKAVKSTMYFMKNLLSNSDRDLMIVKENMSCYPAHQLLMHNPFIICGYPPPCNPRPIWISQFHLRQK